MQPDAVDRCDLYRSADLANQAAETFLKLIIGCQHRFRLSIKNFTGGGQRDFAPSANTLEQAALELIFERPYLLADRRLGDEIALGSERETLKVDEVAEYF